MATWNIHVDQGMDGRLHVRIDAPPRFDGDQTPIMDALCEAAAIIEDLRTSEDGET